MGHRIVMIPHRAEQLLLAFQLERFPQPGVLADQEAGFVDDYLYAKEVLAEKAQADMQKGGPQWPRPPR